MNQLSSISQVVNTVSLNNKKKKRVNFLTNKTKQNQPTSGLAEIYSVFSPSAVSHLVSLDVSFVISGSS